MVNKLEILSCESVYHIYNRAIGNDKLFYSENNYFYFLKKFEETIVPFCDVFCYCLMPNHFHFLIRIKPEAEIILHFESSFDKTTFTKFSLELKNNKQKSISKYISLQFSHLFNGYTQAINKQEIRKGGLFMRPFKRIVVKDAQYLKKLVQYIHLNPIEANLCNNPEEWKYSSYSLILKGENSFVRTTEVISWFDDASNFKTFHAASREMVETV